MNDSRVDSLLDLQLDPSNEKKMKIFFSVLNQGSAFGEESEQNLSQLVAQMLVMINDINFKNEIIRLKRNYNLVLDNRYSADCLKGDYVKFRDCYHVKYPKSFKCFEKVCREILSKELSQLQGTSAA